MYVKGHQNNRQTQNPTAPPPRFEIPASAPGHDKHWSKGC